MTATKILVDTNIVSDIMRGGEKAKAYAPHLHGKPAAISFMTVGEMYYGAEKAHWGENRRLRLEMTFRNFVVIPYDHEIAKRYGTCGRRA